jgi:ABC-2 type transport system permease protein/sodium transport system permease protein
LTSQLGRVGRLVRKELNEILRDRRTIITLVLMPLLLYPLLYIAFQQLVLAGQKSTRGPVYRLGFLSEREARLVARYLAWKTTPDGTHPTWVDPRIQRDGPRPLLKLFAPDDPEAAGSGYLEELLRGSAIDLGIRVRHRARQPAGEGRGPALDLDLIYLEDSSAGREALRWLESQRALANTHILQERLRQLHVPLRAEPVQTERVPLKDPEAQSGNLPAALVPLILILMTITGAVYPAIDLTAGERERGTLEILVAAPVPRLGLLFAKYVTVLTVAVLTALVNLGMMTGTLLVTGLGSEFFGGPGLSPVVVLEVFALLLMFAAFFSAVLLTLTSFARSFKEAQAYLIPLMLASLAPGLLGMLPGLSLSGPLCVVPLINIVLLARDLLDPARSIDPVAALVVVVSTLLYALAALAVAARIFGAEGVLYSEQSSWADLFRRPTEPRRVARVGGALLCLALMFPAYFFAHALLARWPGVPPALRVLFPVLLTILLFGGFPLAAAVLTRVELTTGFQLHRAPWPAYLGAVFLGLSLWPFVLALLAGVQQVDLATLGPEHEKMVQELLATWRQLPPAWIVLAYAVVPAVLEEFFFRGYLFSALRAQAGPAATIFGSAALFGIFHVFFAFDRIVPSTLLGVVLGWVCWQTRGVFPGMVLHACHNGLLVLVSYYADDIRRWGWFDPETADLPPSLFLAAALGAALGAVLICLGSRSAPGSGEGPAGDARAGLPLH